MKNLSVPMGNISKEKLEPWFQWLSKQNFDEFASFPEIANFFKEIFPSYNPGGDPRPGYVCDYLSGNYEEPDNFIKKGILFYVYMNIFQAGEMHAHSLVKFLLDGTVTVEEIYLDDTMITDSIEKNIKRIDSIIEQKQTDKKLSWKEFIQLYEEITSGMYGEEFTIPEF